MSLTSTPAAERVHIGFFGLRNAGKSSLVNALAGQTLSIVSPTPGTTTDTVHKTMELLPIGPVVLLDTPGLDDEGELGLLRVEAAKKAFAKTDLTVFVTDAAHPLTEQERAFLDTLEKEKKPHLIVCNKCDRLQEKARQKDRLYVSAKTGEGIEDLRGALGRLAAENKTEKFILKDLVAPGEIVLLVTPIDAAAPKGRLILPQQQTLRELIDLHAAALVCQPEEVGGLLRSLKRPPKLVITDSQAFSQVAKSVPDEIPLTSFSILFARYKGDLEALVRGAGALKNLSDSSRVLISEGCTHRRQCGDIGTVKLPAAIRRLTGKNPAFSFTSGGEFPSDTSAYDVIVHCGGCMLGEAEMKSRMARAAAQGTPMTNYGVALALSSGILKRALAPFGGIAELV